MASEAAAKTIGVSTARRPTWRSTPTAWSRRGTHHRSGRRWRRAVGAELAELILPDMRERHRAGSSATTRPVRVRSWGRGAEMIRQRRKNSWLRSRFDSIAVDEPQRRRQLPRLRPRHHQAQAARAGGGDAGGRQGVGADRLADRAAGPAGAGRGAGRRLCARPARSAAAASRSWTSTTSRCSTTPTAIGGRHAARELRIRQSDLVARYGGEEFAVLLPTCEIGRGDGGDRRAQRSPRARSGNYWPQSRSGTATRPRRR